MITQTTEEIIYSIEDKIPKKGEIVLVLIDDEIQGFHTQWFRRDYQKLPLHFHWEAAEMQDISYGYPSWGKLNLSAYASTFRQYITHWKYITPPPEELRGKEYS